MSRPLTAVMAGTLGDTIDHGGELVRHQGGYWSYPGCPRLSHNGAPEWYAGTSTVQALVTRGEMEYVEWKEGRKGRFPIRARVKLSSTLRQERADG